MAASRLEKYATIFLRVQGLLRTGVMKEAHKPLWYDVYERYPPHVEPRAFRPVPEKSLNAILYPEDEIRAKFYKEFRLRTPIDLTASNTDRKMLSQKFIDKYMELSTNTGVDEEIFKRTEEAINAEGITLRFEKRKFQKDLRHEDEDVDGSIDTEGFIADVNEYGESEIIDDYSDIPKGDSLKFDLKSVMDEK